MSYIDSMTKEKIEVNKLSGFQHKQCVAMDSVTDENFSDLIDTAVQGTNSRLKIPQARKNARNLGENDIEIIDCFLRNDIRSGRILIDKGHDSIPYGMNS